MLKASARLQWARCAAGTPGARGFRVLGWSGSRPVHGVVEARSRTHGSLSWMPESRVRFDNFQPPSRPNLPLIVLTSEQKIHHGGTETRRTAQPRIARKNANWRDSFHSRDSRLNRFCFFRPDSPPCLRGRFLVFRLRCDSARSTLIFANLPPSVTLCHTTPRASTLHYIDESVQLTHEK